MAQSKKGNSLRELLLKNGNINPGLAASVRTKDPEASRKAAIQARQADLKGKK